MLAWMLVCVLSRVACWHAGKQAWLSRPLPSFLVSSDVALMPSGATLKSDVAALSCCLGLILDGCSPLDAELFDFQRFNPMQENRICGSPGEDQAGSACDTLSAMFCGVCQVLRTWMRVCMHASQSGMVERALAQVLFCGPELRCDLAD